MVRLLGVEVCFRDTENGDEMMLTLRTSTILIYRQKKTLQVLRSLRLFVPAGTAAVI